MRSGFLSASTRRALLAVAAAALLCGASGTGALRAAGAGQEADPLKFSGDTALVIWTVKDANAADFESGWAAIKAKLSASEKPDLKEQGASMNMYKVTGTPAGSSIYMFYLNPPSKTLSYDPSKILFMPGMWPDAEARAIYKKIADGLENINPLVLGKVGG